MKKKQPELVTHLELYQDKCADVLASIFIDHKTPDQLSIQQYIQPLVDTLNTFTKSANDTLISMNDRMSALEKAQQPTTPNQSQNKKYSYWYSKMYPKYLLIMEYFNITECKELYKQLYWELQNTYPDIELNQIIDDYCYENHLNTCYTLDAIEHDKSTRKLFENVVDNILEKYSLIPETRTARYKTIFDDTDNTNENITKAS